MRKDAIGNVTFCFDHPLLWHALLGRLWKICEIRQVIFFFRTIFGQVKVQPTTPSRALKMCRFQQTAIIYFSSLFICNILLTTMGNNMDQDRGHQSIYVFKIRNVRKPSCQIIFCCFLRKMKCIICNHLMQPDSIDCVR